MFMGVVGTGQEGRKWRGWFTDLSTTAIPELWQGEMGHEIIPTAFFPRNFLLLLVYFVRFLRHTELFCDYYLRKHLVLGILHLWGFEVLCNSLENSLGIVQSRLLRHDLFRKFFFSSFRREMYRVVEINDSMIWIIRFRGARYF